jgi:Asp-tRNA(Asn)/Glu-tRNA(Gln) amidotransferase C subunit
MTQDEVLALARLALLDLSPAEAAALAAGLTPVVARIAALPAGTAEEAQSTRADPPALRPDVPGAALPVELALAGVPAHAGGLVLVRPLAARTAGDAP